MDSTAKVIDISKTQAYRDRLAGFLGSKNPLEVLAATADVLRRIVRQYPAATLRKRPYEGKWTPNEVLGHLMDAEWTMGWRIRTICCDDNPKLMPMDQEKWVAVQKHNEKNPEDLLESFSAMRKVNLNFWRSVDPSRYSRTGLHAERGEESLGLILRMHAGHDLSHIDQIERYIKAVVS